MSASRISFDEIVKRHAFGRLRPLTSISLTSEPGREPISSDHLGRRLADQHAVVAPDVVDDRFVELVAADAHELVDHAAERDPPTSVVPPPMSTTIEPLASETGSPAPIAAAIGSSIR